MVQSDNFGYLFIYLWEWAALPLYIIIILYFANSHKRRREKYDPLYSYYTNGLIIKLFGGVVFASIYYYYYKGGDTFSYYDSALAMNNLLTTSFKDFLQNEFLSANHARYFLFTSKTGFPVPYMYYDHQTFMVIRLFTPILLLAFKGYLLTSVIAAWISYIGLWKLFKVFVVYYPELKNEFFIAIICFPSVIFWGSGISKDTITLTCSAWVVYSAYNIFIVKRRIFINLVTLIITFYIVLNIKPYIIFALSPGLLMWITSSRIYRIKNNIVKALILPFILAVCLLGGYLILSSLDSYMGKFSLDKVTTTAVVTETDLKQDYYGGHSFDIGKFENTPSGYAKIFPKAFVAGAYRPFIWESGNAVMLISALENLLLLYLTFLALRRGIFKMFSRMFNEPLLFFCVSFSIFFAFAVGLTTSNFGALVRFKIAYLPFFVSALFILASKKESQVADARKGKPIYGIAQANFV